MPAPKKERAVAPASSELDLQSLASGLAHEILNPLAGLAGAIDLLAHDLPPGHSRHELLQQMRGEVERIQKLVSGFCEYAQPKALQRVTADVNTTVLQSAALARMQLAAGTQINVFPCAELPPLTHDPMRLKQALVAIVTAAVRAAPDHSCVEVRVSRNAGSATIEITDSAAVLAESARAKLFQPFGGTGKGAGMALPLARVCVEQHGGSIETREAAPGGNSILIRLPLKPPRQ